MMAPQRSYTCIFTPQGETDPFFVPIKFKPSNDRHRRAHKYVVIVWTHILLFNRYCELWYRSTAVMLPLQLHHSYYCLPAHVAMFYAKSLHRRSPWYIRMLWCGVVIVGALRSRKRHHDCDICFNAMRRFDEPSPISYICAKIINLKQILLQFAPNKVLQFDIYYDWGHLQD